LKDKSLEPKLGEMLTMLITMTDRGPDSAGIAIYGGAGTGSRKSPCSRPTRMRILPRWMKTLRMPSAAGRDAGEKYPCRS
jgi:hypothetical protein